MEAMRSLSIIEAMYITDDMGNLVFLDWSLVEVFAEPEWND